MASSTPSIPVRRSASDGALSRFQPCSSPSLAARVQTVLEDSFEEVSLDTSQASLYSPSEKLAVLQKWKEIEILTQYNCDDAAKAVLLTIQENLPKNPLGLEAVWEARHLLGLAHYSEGNKKNPLLQGAKDILDEVYIHPEKWSQSNMKERTDVYEELIYCYTLFTNEMPQENTPIHHEIAHKIQACTQLRGPQISTVPASPLESALSAAEVLAKHRCPDKARPLFIEVESQLRGQRTGAQSFILIRCLLGLSGLFPHNSNERVEMTKRAKEELDKIYEDAKAHFIHLDVQENINTYTQLATHYFTIHSRMVLRGIKGEEFDDIELKLTECEQVRDRLKEASSPLLPSPATSSIPFSPAVKPSSVAPIPSSGSWKTEKVYRQTPLANIE
jgi:hypothetical protein